MRFFTPEVELALCGHATIAAVSTLARRGELPGLGTTFATAVGAIRAFRDAPRPDVGWMIQPRVDLRAARSSIGAIASAVGLAPADVSLELPAIVAGATIATLLVPLASRDALRRARPRGDLAAIGAAEEVRSVHLFSLETEDPLADACARHLACASGREDPVTGMANGALAVHLHGIGRGRPLITVSQGVEVGRPGRVMVVVQDGRPHVGGPTAKMGEIEVDV